MRILLLILPALVLPSCALFGELGGETTPAVVDVRSEWATTAMAEGEYVEAIKLFDEILSNDPENIPAWIGMGDAYSELGEWEHAEPAFGAACNLNPESYDAQFGHGLSLQMLNRLVEAVMAYHRALTIDPMSSEASLGVATAYLQLNEPQHALPFAHRAVELDENDGRSWVSLGAAYEQSGEEDAALDAYLAASERLVSSPELKHNLLHAYARAGRHREVVGTARSMLADGPSAEAAERMGWAWFRLGDYGQSTDAYRLAVETDPAMWRAWNGLGVNALNRWLLSDQSNAEALAEASNSFQASLSLHQGQNKVTQLVEQYGL